METNEKSQNLTGQRAKLAVVTGTGGLGFEAALALAVEGISVVMAGRNPAKGRASVAAIRSKCPTAQISFEQMDLASLSSIADFASRMHDRVPSIDILINNAGIMTVPQRNVTQDGFELQFGVNYLGHFALTAGLMPLLTASESPRVVHVTSLAHRYGAIDFEDLQSEKSYRAGVVYCRSKLAVALFARELQAQANQRGIDLLSVPVHPGFSVTGLFDAENGKAGLSRWVSLNLIAPILGQSAAEGAASLILAATSPSIPGAQLYGPTGLLQMKGKPGPCSFGRQALDAESARKLWEISERLVRLEVF